MNGNKTSWQSAANVNKWKSNFRKKNTLTHTTRIASGWSEIDSIKNISQTLFYEWNTHRSHTVYFTSIRTYGFSVFVRIIWPWTNRICFYSRDFFLSGVFLLRIEIYCQWIVIEKVFFRHVFRECFGTFAFQINFVIFIECVFFLSAQVIGK